MSRGNLKTDLLDVATFLAWKDNHKIMNIYSINGLHMRLNLDCIKASKTCRYELIQDVQVGKSKPVQLHLLVRCNPQSSKLQRNESQYKEWHKGISNQAPQTPSPTPSSLRIHKRTRQAPKEGYFESIQRVRYHGISTIPSEKARKGRVRTHGREKIRGSEGLPS